ncbi:MAG: peptidoglycan-binding protein [Actinomycetota bacterium]|nr:peptidoglycan-binding protein [Actinomycetota bacterium]
MPFSGVAFGLPFAMNSVEGFEASMFVAAAASRSTWRRAATAVVAAAVTLVPFGVLLWLAFHYFGAQYLDYAIAVLVFVLGARELREGLSERPSGHAAGERGRVERIGFSATSAASISRFQAAHGLEPTAVVDAPTRVALLAARRAAGYEQVDPFLFGVDAADASAVAEFQRRHGLDATGDVDAMTRGAMRVAQQQGLIDVLCADAVRRFQRSHGLDDTGDVDHATSVALATVRSEGATTPRGRKKARIDPIDAWHGLDAANAASIKALQRSLGLDADGAIGPETRGALIAMRARLVVDPADPSAVLQLQARHDLPATGVIDTTTREVLSEETSKMFALSGGARNGEPDVCDEDAVRYFQRRYGLEADGVVDDKTQAALRYERDWFAGLDPTNGDSVRHFQADVRLPVDGVVGPLTQAAVRTIRAQRAPHSGRARKKRYGPVSTKGPIGPRIDLDIADTDSIRAFQARHDLPVTGEIGPDTQEALALVRRAGIFGESRLGAHRLPAHNHTPIGRLRALLGDAWPAYVGVILETSEALLYSFAVGSSSFALLPALVGAGIGFAWPWSVIPLLRKLTASVAEWKQEAVIGAVLVSVAASFGLLHMVGVFH